MTILAAVFVFGLVVLVHELGHFIVAKLVGMRVDEFAIGFGPKLISFQKGETRYSLRAIPLGGFNKIAGMDPEEELDDRSYLKKPIGFRFLVIAAGSMMNLLLPILIFFLIYTGVGLVQPVNDLPVPGEVLENRAAQKAGFLPDDQVISINGKSVGTWKEMTQQIQTLPGDRPAVFLVKRQNQEKSLQVVPEKDERSGRVVIGIMQKSERVRVGPIDAIVMSFDRTWKLTYAIYDGLKQMVTSKAVESDNSDLVVISVPGEYAAGEARMALEHGKNVMIFSDNVEVSDELALKQYAHERELLVMGPDCGTA